MPEIIYVKADAESVAQCYKQFFVDVLKSKCLYSISRERAVRHLIKGLSNKNTARQSINAADSEFEQVLADIMQHTNRDTKTADDLKLTNAMGYDVCSISNNLFIEAKLYSVSASGNKLSASVTNIENKFCSIVILVIDPYLTTEKKYRLYALPPDAVTSDTSDYITIVHHKLTEINNGIFVSKQCDKIGGNKEQFQVSIDNISKCDFSSINMKRLSMCLRKLETMQHNSARDEFLLLNNLWCYCIRSHNKKSKSKYPLDYNDSIYDINNISRLIFKGAKINCLQTQEVQDEEL